MSLFKILYLLYLSYKLLYRLKTFLKKNDCRLNKIFDLALLYNHLNSR